MNRADLEITTGWMNWAEIVPYRDQLVQLEQILFTEFHYPDRYNGKEYCEKKVEKLEQFLANGNTYFWGARCGSELVGYYWAYTMQFVDKKRWCLSSLMIKDQYRNFGLGSKAIEEGLKMAKKVCCNEAATQYVPWNEAAANVYQRAGYKITRYEVVKRLDEKEER